ncbi:MAG: class I fructose-bisphosphate aldolase [bacterium]|nr:class I fructose-bisphosphate aldolase [bacterium]
MDTALLETTARALVAAGKGILAADESAGTANKRFAAVGVEQTEENRRQYRQLLLTTPEAKGTLSGVIFYDETFWQNADDGEPLRTYCAEKSIIPGIKVDEGLVDLPGFPNEKVSKGLDTLPERVMKYRDAGAKFAKWRSVIAIGKTEEGTTLPTEECINANAFVLARYARICQDTDIVPIVEPEVLFDGKHTAKECEDALARVLDELFVALRAYRTHLPGVILKTSMVLPGKESGIVIDSEDVAERTARVLQEYVPEELGGVVFLSGGQTSADAFKNLDAIAKRGPYPWGVTFSYSRALQDPVLKHWATKRDDTSGAKAIFAQHLAFAVAAREGKLETTAGPDNFVSAGQDV